LLKKPSLVLVTSPQNRRAGPGDSITPHLHLPNRRVLAAVLGANLQRTRGGKLVRAKCAT
jgi:hypothetical protein